MRVLLAIASCRVLVEEVEKKRCRIPDTLSSSLIALRSWECAVA